MPADPVVPGHQLGHPHHEREEEGRVQRPRRMRPPSEPVADILDPVVKQSRPFSPVSEDPGLCENQQSTMTVEH